MHILIGAISALAGLIWAFVALQRAGLDLNSLNPFLWLRRARWKQKYCEKPIYTLDQPLDVAALLLLGVAKCEGEISAEQKSTITAIYENEFHLDREEASDLLLASAHLLRDEIYLVDNLPRILAKSAPAFTPEQVISLLALLRRVGSIEGALNGEQTKLIEAVQNCFDKSGTPSGKWR